MKYLTLESGGSLELAYYITVDEVFDEGEALFENYGICARLAGGDEDSIRGITVKADKIELLLQVLSDGYVTPISLRDVLYDLLEILV
jgi:hypothetical protein